MMKLTVCAPCTPCTSVGTQAGGNILVLNRWILQVVVAHRAELGDEEVVASVVRRRVFLDVRKLHKLQKRGEKSMTRPQRDSRTWSCHRGNCTETVNCQE